MPPPQELPYTQTLSALRKNDLLRLTVEFRLPVEGSVVILRNQLKKYLNSHRDTLYRNPRFTALYPKHRRPARQSSFAPSNSRNSRSTPSVSPSPHPSPSPTPSYGSWNGIEDETQHAPSTITRHSPPHAHFHSPVHYHPHPISPIPNPEPALLLPGDQVVVDRK
jgi:hypothetical protein